MFLIFILASEFEQLQKSSEICLELMVHCLQGIAKFLPDNAGQEASIVREIPVVLMKNFCVAKQELLRIQGQLNALQNKESRACDDTVVPTEASKNSVMALVGDIEELLKRIR